MKNYGQDNVSMEKMKYVSWLITVILLTFGHSDTFGHGDAFGHCDTFGHYDTFAHREQRSQKRGRSITTTVVLNKNYFLRELNKNYRFTTLLCQCEYELQFS